MLILLTFCAVVSTLLAAECNRTTFQYNSACLQQHDAAFDGNLTADSICCGTRLSDCAHLPHNQCLQPKCYSIDNRPYWREHRRTKRAEGNPLRFQPGEFPFLGQLRRVFSYQDNAGIKHEYMYPGCSSVVIDSFHVLLAWHCVHGYLNLTAENQTEYPVRVLLGQHKQPEYGSEVTGILYDVESISVPSHLLEGRDKGLLGFLYEQTAVFNYGGKHIANDIAVVKVKTEIVMSDLIQPACLTRPEDTFPAGSKCYSLGYGRGVNIDDNDVHLPDLVLTRVGDEDKCRENLAKAHTAEVLSTTSQQYLKSSNILPFLYWSLPTKATSLFEAYLKNFYPAGTGVCAVSERGLPCFGDSGGPLMCRSSNDYSYRLVGVLSFGGLWNCHRKISMYASTMYSKNREWIDEMRWKW